MGSTAKDYMLTDNVMDRGADKEPIKWDWVIEWRWTRLTVQRVASVTEQPDDFLFIITLIGLNNGSLNGI